MKFLKKVFWGVFGLSTIYFVFKKIFSYIINVSSEKRVWEVKSEMTAETMKIMLANNKKSKEIDEIVENATPDEFSGLQ